MNEPKWLSDYVPLWCKSNYSFLEGASHPEELVEQAALSGIRSIAITDRDGIYGIVRAHTRARELGIHLIIGAQITIDDGSSVVLLATNRRGYTNLCRLISIGRLRSPKGECSVNWREVCSHAKGLIALWGGSRSLILQKADPVFIARDLREAFGDRLYALLTRHHRPGEMSAERRLRDRARRYRLRTVAATEVLYHTPARRDLQDVLTCIRNGVTLSSAGRLIRANSEHTLKSPPEFCGLYENDPESVFRTEEVAARCSFSLAQIRYRYPAEKLPDGTTSTDHLRHLTHEGAKERYPNGLPPDVAAQLDKELALIHELDYEGYFLTMWEIVQFCRHHNILCQGRGSAANSAVCYCLGITAVDPVRMGLLFERFISRERAEPPDIDLDIEHNRREEVIQYVYNKYGRARAAMVANFIRYRSRSAIREVGKVLGISDTAIDRFAKMMSYFDAVSPDMLRQTGFDPKNPTHHQLLRLSLEIQDFPRHLSIHPGGFLLGHEPVRDLVPIENATMPDRTVIQWDKEDLESLGLFKVDLLGLGMLTCVHHSIDLIETHTGKKLSMTTIPPCDEPTFEMIRRADTVGVFQIESRAQMAMLPRLKPRTYYDLVVEVSIVRPGPITGGMVHPYLRRRNGEEEITYPHPSLEPVLEKTLGVPLFQEQVMRLAMVAADYTPGEADQLRRDMAAWRRSGRLGRHRDRLISRMMAKGISEQFAEQVFKQIQGFGEYGFPESHAASFALIAYASAYLKCHYPAAFTCALLNAQPMGFYVPSTIIDDAKRRGVVVRPVDVQTSRWECALEPSPESGEGYAIRMGFGYVRGMRQGEGETITRARGREAFRSVEDVARRTSLENGIMRRLAEAGAFEALDKNRRYTIWQVRGLDTLARPELPLVSRSSKARIASLSSFETIEWDYRSTGHSPRDHPLALVRDDLSRQGLPEARTVVRMRDGERIRYAGIVICRQRPSTAGGVVFMTLEDETGFVNVVLWQHVFRRHMVLAKTASFLGITGRLQVSSGVVHLIAESLWTPRHVHHQPQRGKSRDFH